MLSRFSKKRSPLVAIDRRAFLTILLSAVVCVDAGGCATFSKKDKNDDKKEKEKEEDVFESERKKQDADSEFLARQGRKSKEKKDVPKGQTFLLSDKAKEIYANTER